MSDGTFTPDDIRAWGPCWNGEELDRVINARAAWTVDDGIDLWAVGRLSAKDLLWCVLRRGVLSDKVLRLHAVRSARRALERERAARREPDARSWAATDVAERHAHGAATHGELRGARYAADAAAYAADAASAYAAAAAADDADAADAADEREAQVEDLILLVAGERLEREVPA